MPNSENPVERAAWLRQRAEEKAREAGARRPALINRVYDE